MYKEYVNGALVLRVNQMLRDQDVHTVEAVEKYRKLNGLSKS